MTALLIALLAGAAMITGVIGWIVDADHVTIDRGGDPGGDP